MTNLARFFQGAAQARAEIEARWDLLHGDALREILS